LAGGVCDSDHEATFNATRGATVAKCCFDFDLDQPCNTSTTAVNARAERMRFGTVGFIRTTVLTNPSLAAVLAVVISWDVADSIEPFTLAVRGAWNLTVTVQAHIPTLTVCVTATIIDTRSRGGRWRGDGRSTSANTINAGLAIRAVCIRTTIGGTLAFPINTLIAFRAVCIRTTVVGTLAFSINTLIAFRTFFISTTFSRTVTIVSTASITAVLSSGTVGILNTIRAEAVS